MRLWGLSPLVKSTLSRRTNEQWMLLPLPQKSLIASLCRAVHALTADDCSSKRLFAIHYFFAAGWNRDDKVFFFFFSIISHLLTHSLTEERREKINGLDRQRKSLGAITRRWRTQKKFISFFLYHLFLFLFFPFRALGLNANVSIVWLLHTFSSQQSVGRKGPIIGNFWFVTGNGSGNFCSAALMTTSNIVHDFSTLL